MGKKITYFIDDNYDSVCPCGGKPELVEKYGALLKHLDRELIGIYKTKLELYKDVAEYASQARHGVEDYEYLEDEELEERISNLEEEIREEEEEKALKNEIQVFEIKCDGYKITPELLICLLQDYQLKITGKTFCGLSAREVK